LRLLADAKRRRTLGVATKAVHEFPDNSKAELPDQNTTDRAYCASSKLALRFPLGFGRRDVICMPDTGRSVTLNTR
jgi:hypothetical protein